MPRAVDRGMKAADMLGKPYVAAFMFGSQSWFQFIALTFLLHHAKRSA